MRVLNLLWALALLSLLLPGAAHARCSSGGEDICATENGHYRIRLPQGFGPHPTVVYLYGSTGNSGEIINNDAFIRAFVSRGYAVIVPAALDIKYNDGRDSGWFLRNERHRKPRDEIAFVDEVLRDAETNYLIDRNRILMAGMSRGGFLTWEIACHRPDLAQAYAPVAAGYLGGMPERCQAPVRLLHTHGTADKTVPFEQQKAWYSGGARLRELDDALDTIGETGGCTTRGPTTRRNGFERSDWQDCGPGASVGLLVHNGGHTIPRGWIETVVNWFETAPRRAPQSQQGGGTAVFRGLNDRSTGTSRFKRVPGTQ